MNHPQSHTFRLSSRYDLGPLIGRGGMADVYEAKDWRLGRRVAIKRLRPELAQTSPVRRRFYHEAQAVAKLNHPCIVTVFDHGEQPASPDTGGVPLPYIVMELVEGTDLRKLIREGRLPLQDSFDVIDQILRALSHSHQNGIVHRDIKPGNILLTEKGGVKVTDFGIARALASDQNTLTAANTVMGTAAYLSPEQAQGKRVDARSDLYSAACVFYEILTQRPPFIGESPVSVAYQHVNEQPPAPSLFNVSLSSGIDNVILKALSKEPSQRFINATEMRTAISSHRHDAWGENSQQEPTTASLTGLFPAQAAAEPPVFSSGGTPRRGLLIAAGAAATAALAGGGVFLWGNRGESAARPSSIRIPDVSRLTQSQAAQKLEQAGLQHRFGSAASQVIARGMVVATQPAHSTTIDPQEPVTILVSTGPSHAALPSSLLGAKEAAAKKILTSINMKADASLSANSPTAPAGTVTAVSPPVGTDVPAGTAVVLTISTGKVSMPDLVGLTEAQAVDALKANSLRLPYKVVKVDPGKNKPGTVIAQSAKAQSLIPAGTTIRLTVTKSPPAPKPSAPKKPAPKPKNRKPPAKKTSFQDLFRG